MRIIQDRTIYQLTFYNRKSLSVNCYLVEEADGLILIDTAIPGCSEGILEAAETIGKPISGIVLTHAHHDHIGSLDELKKEMPEVPVYISAREARLIAGDFTLDVDEQSSPIRGIIPKNLKTQPDVLLQGGDRIGSLLAIAAPGHTPGSMAFLDTRNNALIAGDAFQTEGCVAIAGQPCPSFPFLAAGTWSKSAALESARILRTYEPILLAVGHGEMLKEPIEVIDRIIREAANNLALEE